MKKEKIDHNIIERITFGFGVVVMVGLLSYLGYNITRQHDGPPEIQITSTYRPSMKHYGFEVQLENTGQQTAENVDIRFHLYQDGVPTADAALTFQYIPVQSSQTAWLTFYEKHSATDSLVVESVTFVKP